MENNRSKELSLGWSYFRIVRWVIGLTILFAVLAAVLSVYADWANKPGGAVEGSINALWHCVTLSVGGLVGLLTGSKLATTS